MPRILFGSQAATESVLVSHVSPEVLSLGDR
jgi:hypothetical protein